MLKSKTVWFAILIAVLSVVQGFVGFLPASPWMQMAVGIALAVIITILRALTTQPLSSK